MDSMVLGKLPSLIVALPVSTGIATLSKQRIEHLRDKSLALNRRQVNSREWERCSLKSGVAPESDLWETFRMVKKQFVPATGDIVASLYKRGTFKVLAISHGGQTAAIQSFNISKQKLL